MTTLRSYFWLGFLGLAFFGDLLLHPDEVLYSDHSDMLAMHLPMKRFLVRAWHETGEVPLWNPHCFGGMPFVHDVQVAAFYPPHFILYLLSEERVGTAMSWLIVAHVLAAGWCMLAYARWQGLGPAGAFVAALGYMFAGKWLLHVLAAGHYIMIPLCWLPLVLLLLEKALKRGSVRLAAWAGTAFALLILGTHPQMTLYAGVFIMVWTLQYIFYADTDDARPRSTRFVRWLGLGSVLAMTAAALSAIQLLPALEAAPESTRGVGVAAGEVLAVAFPSVLSIFGPGWTPAWETRAGLGILWLAAACSAPMLLPGRTRFQAGVVLGLLLFSWGGAALVQGLPGFRLFQIPVRMMMLAALPIALLAGQATNLLAGQEAAVLGARRRCRAMLVRLFSLAILLACISGLSACRAWQREHAAELGQADRVAAVEAWFAHLDVSVAVYWITAIVAVTLAFWMLRDRCGLQNRAWTWGWTGLLLAEAWGLAWPQVAVRSEESIYPISPLVRRLSSWTIDSFRILDRGVAGYPSSSPLGPALPMLGSVNLQSVLGYNSFDVRRYKEFLQFIYDETASIHPREGLFGYPISQSFPIKNRQLVDLLGVLYLLQPTEPMPHFDAAGEPGVDAAWKIANQRMVKNDSSRRPVSAYSFLAGGMQELPSFTMWSNRNVFPHAFLASSAERLEKDAAGVLEQLKTTDLRSVVLLEKENTSLVGPVRKARRSTADIMSYQPNSVELLAGGELSTVLVLTDVWFPGWKVEVDGEEQPVLRADYAFRAVELPAGLHEVVFRFEPQSYEWGRLISQGSAGLLMLMAVMTFAASFNARSQQRGPVEQRPG